LKYGQLHSGLNAIFRHGKTTLLQHVASRKLTIPQNIDLLLCEQGKISILGLILPVCCGNEVRASEWDN